MLSTSRVTSGMGSSLKFGVDTNHGDSEDKGEYSITEVDKHRNRHIRELLEYGPRFVHRNKIVTSQTLGDWDNED